MFFPYESENVVVLFEFDKERETSGWILYFLIAIILLQKETHFYAASII